MARRTAPQRRVVVGGEGGARRMIMAPSVAPLDELSLDDRPLAIERSTDARYLIVTLPYELWIVDAKTLAEQRTIPLTMPRPSVVEGWEGALWIGGQHLFRGSLGSTTVTKAGSKLGGYVDHVTLIRDDLLCGVGSQGELLWDIDRGAPVHKRKSPGPAAIGVVASADGRAVFSDASQTAWVIDPAHPAGYAQLRLNATSPVPVKRESLVCLARTDGTRGGRILLAARDGAVAWTTRDLRLAGERVPAGKRDMTPLAIAGDERWVYVLRRRGTLQRFLIAQPNAPRGATGSGGSGKKRKHHQSQPLPGQQTGELEPPPLPEAQEVRLDKLAECMTLLIDDDKRSLVLGGPKADGQLGRLWVVDPDALEWQELQLGARTLEPLPPPPDPDAEPPAPVRPSFIATKNKLSGPKISAVSVDDIVGKIRGAGVEYWLTHSSGTVLDRPTELPGEHRSVADILPGDAILLPAMVRFNEGTARPALLIWPGRPATPATPAIGEDHEAPPPEPQLLVWGDDPRAWMPLETPRLRDQKWARTDVFPIQVALAGVPEGLPGKRQVLDAKWIDPQHFEAMAKECKKLLKVLW